MDNILDFIWMYLPNIKENPLFKSFEKEKIHLPLVITLSNTLYHLYFKLKSLKIKASDEFEGEND